MHTVVEYQTKSKLYNWDFAYRVVNAPVDNSQNNDMTIPYGFLSPSSDDTSTLRGSNVRQRSRCFRDSVTHCKSNVP